MKNKIRRKKNLTDTSPLRKHLFFLEWIIALVRWNKILASSWSYPWNWEYCSANLDAKSCTSKGITFILYHLCFCENFFVKLKALNFLIYARFQWRFFFSMSTDLSCCFFQSPGLYRNVAQRKFTSAWHAWRWLKLVCCSWIVYDTVCCYWNPQCIWPVVPWSVDWVWRK